jgi:hypothetical protein
MQARYDSKPLRLAAKVYTKPGKTEGFVTRMGLLRLKRGGNAKVDVYFIERKARGYFFMRRHMYLASFLTYKGPADDPAEDIAEGQVEV